MADGSTYSVYVFTFHLSAFLAPHVRIRIRHRLLKLLSRNSVRILPPDLPRSAACASARESSRQGTRRLSTNDRENPFGDHVACDVRMNRPASATAHPSKDALAVASAFRIARTIHSAAESDGSNFFGGNFVWVELAVVDSQSSSKEYSMRQTRASCRHLEAFILACGLTACSREPSTEEQCERVRDRIIDLQLRRDDADRDAHARVVRRAMGAEFVTTCARSTSEAQRECVLAAKDSKTALACSDPRRTDRALANGRTK